MKKPLFHDLSRIPRFSAGNQEFRSTGDRGRIPSLVDDAVLLVHVGGEEGRRWREGTAMVRRLWLVCVKVEVRETAVQRKEDSEGSAEDGVFGSSLS